MKSKIPAYAAIVSAIIFFISLIVSLLGYGISAGAIKITSLQQIPLGSLFVYIVNHFNGVMFSIYALLLITNTIIYYGFADLSKRLKIKSLFYTSYMMLIVFFISSLIFIIAFLYPQSYNTLLIKPNTANLIFGAVGIIFGINLIFQNKSFSMLFKPIGVLYIAEGIILFSTLLIPVKITDFLIPIKILEAVLFFQTAKKD